MRMYLKVLDGSQAGNEIKVSGPKFLIGRDADCHLRPRSDLISRHHCVIIVEQGYAGVRDFGSKNGTCVNGERILSECQLKEGDELTVGPLRFQVHVDHAASGRKRPKVKDMSDAVLRTTQMDDGDADIADWLGDEADDAGDTRQAPLLDTGQLKALQSATSDTKEIDLSEDDSASSYSGKLPPEVLAKMQASQQQGKSKDTQSAAESVLRQMRQQKQGQKK